MPAEARKTFYHDGRFSAVKSFRVKLYRAAARKCSERVKLEHQPNLNSEPCAVAWSLLATNQRALY